MCPALLLFMRCVHVDVVDADVDVDVVVRCLLGHGATTGVIDASRWICTLSM